jgi:capsular polysaccharide biosynthesis protein
MFTWAAVGVTVVAVITAFFILDAKDNYQGETQVL